MNKILIGLVCVALVLSVLAFTKPGQVVVREVREVVGAAGNTYTNRLDFLTSNGLAGWADLDNTIPVIGNGGTQSSSTVTASSTQICPNNVLRVNFPTATGTITLPTPANFRTDGRCLSTLGSFKVFFLTNANDLAPGTTTIAIGASSSISTVSSTAVLPLTFLSSTTLRLTGIRISSSGQEWIIWEHENFR